MTRFCKACLHFPVIKQVIRHTGTGSVVPDIRAIASPVSVLLADGDSPFSERSIVSFCSPVRSRGLTDEEHQTVSGAECTSCPRTSSETP